MAVALLSFTTPVVGASGAIFGLFGALIVIGRHIGANIAGIAIILGVNLVIGFIPGFNVSWQAHVGGLVVGALVGLIYARTRSVRRRALQIWLLVALTVVLLRAAARAAAALLLGRLALASIRRSRQVIHRFIHSWG